MNRPAPASSRHTSSITKERALMLERRSALAEARPYMSPVLEMGEVRELTLVQAAALSGDFEKKLAGIVGKLPETIGVAIESQGLTIMKTGPRAFWLIGAGTSEL